MDIVHEKDKGFFIYDENKEIIAEMTYQRQENKIIADHTFVSPILRGQGIADKLFTHLISYARENKLKVVPVCSYIVKKFESGDYQDLIVK